MAFDPNKTASGKGGAASAPSGAGGGGGFDPTRRASGSSTPASSGPKESKKRDPQKELSNAIKKLERLEKSGQLKGKDLDHLKKLRYDYALSQVMPTENIGTRSPEKAVAKGLGKALDYIGRPGQAIMSGLGEYATNEDISVLPSPADLGKIAGAAGQGLAGKRHETFSGIAAARGVNLPTAAKLPIDVVFGASLDPVSYLTFGTSAAANQGLKVTTATLGAERAAAVAQRGTKVLTATERAEVAAKTTPKVMEALDKGAKGGLKLAGRTVPGVTSKNVRTAAEATKIPTLARAAGGTRAAQTVKAMFVPRAAVKAKYGSGVADAIDNARIAYRARQNVAIEDDINRIVKAAKDAGATPDELVDMGRTLDVGAGSLAAPIAAKLVPLRDELADIRARFTSDQIDAGVLAEDALHITDEYLPRYLTDAGKKFFGVDDAANAPSFGHVTGTKPLSSADSRNLSARTFGKDQAAADLVDEAGNPLFETDPVKAIARRSVEANRDVAKRGFISDLEAVTDDTGESLFRRIDQESITLDDGSTLTRTTPYPKDWVEVNVPRVGKFAAPKEIADEVNKVIALTVNDESLGAALSLVDDWMQLWKSYATVPLPFGWGFHMRNGVGNVFLNDLAGGIHPGDYSRALKIQRSMAKGKKAGDVLKFLGPEDRELVQQARSLDVLGSGFFDVDAAHDVLGKALGGRTGRFNVNPLNKDNILIRKGRETGGFIEDNARLAHFLGKSRELGDAAAAAKSVRKYLFDYSDLTATEKNLFKRVHAFYTFTRKNVPIQIEAALKTPGKFSKYQRVRDALSADAPDTGGLEPDYLLRGAGTPLPQGVTDALAKVPGLGYKKGEPAMLDLGALLPAGNAVDTLTPLMNLGAEVVPGLDKYRNEEGFAQALGEAIQNTIVGGPAGAATSATEAALGKTLFSGRRLTGQTDRPYALGGSLVGGGKIDKAKLHIIEQNLPLLAKISSTIPRGDKAAQGAGRRRLSTLTGARVTQLNEATRDAEALRRLDVIAEFIARLKDMGVVIPETRSR